MYNLLVLTAALLINFLCVPAMPSASATIHTDPSVYQPSIMPMTDGDAYRSSHHAFAAPVILLDVGHGGIDGGTTEAGVLEKDINLAISQKIYLFASRPKVMPSSLTVSATTHSVMRTGG